MAKEKKKKSLIEANDEKIPPVVHLKYRKGELIVKEGDYGVSIYKVAKGKALVYHEVGDMEVPLAGIGPGEIFGEMAFISRAMEPRSASARAIEDTELEVWHPKLLASEFEKMPQILRYIANQALQRLVRMNTLASNLTDNAAKGKKGKAKKGGASRRSQYRKSVSLDCSYSQATGGVKLSGLIRDISIGGVGMEVRAKNSMNFSHEPGAKFRVEFILPNGRTLNFLAKVESSRKASKPGKIFMGMTFLDMSEDARKNLGFFMMSA
jgi:CRP-like cAMP-binding protein